MESSFLQRVSDVNNISTKDAIKKIDNCFKQVAIDTEKEIGTVIKHFYSYLNPEYNKYCVILDPDECNESIYCTTYKEQCIPIYVKDYVEINRDPDMYIEKLDTEQLKNLRDVAAHLYFNVGDSGIDDNSFNAIDYHLRKRLKKEHKKTEMIGSIPIQKLRAELPYPMPSLNKVHPEDKEYYNFIKNIPEKGIVWSDKLDGVSGMMVYVNGDPTYSYTRGNGVVGGDISYLIEYFTEYGKIPKNIDEKNLFLVRGEFVVKKSIFNEKYKQIYTTARSFVVSQLNKGYITHSIKDIDFVVYEILDEVVNPLKEISSLDLYGFNVVRYGFFNKDVKMMNITLKYKERKDESEYDIDGLVLNYNFVRTEILEVKNPQFKVAYKMQFSQQLRDTVITDVEWNISRYGLYKPVAIFKPVYIEHVRIRRATAHNAAHVRDWSMGNGTKVVVARSGDVMPQIKDVKVDTEIEPIFPEETYNWHWVSKDIVLDDIEGNEFVHKKRILHFFNVIGVAGVGEKTIEKLYDNGFNTVKKILNANPTDLVKIRGIGKLTSERMKERIRNRVVKTPIDRFIEAMTVTNFKISRILIKEVLRTFPSLLDKEMNSIAIENILKTKKIRGIGPKRAIMISEEFPIIRKSLLDLDEDGISKAIEYQKSLALTIKERGYNENITGKTFVFTGFKDTPYELQDYIFNNMGTFTTSVVSSTSMVIAYSPSLLTPKILSANSFKIPIYTETEFRDNVMM